MTSTRCETGYHRQCTGWADYGIPCGCPCHTRACESPAVLPLQPGSAIFWYR